MKCKIIAFYLPQFHETEENNKWWGKGFTEWTNVKRARPLYEGHYQPKIPYRNNYYCLLDPAVQEWQSKIALENGIYGFCYYHYWFNGKLLLEKPMENMLINKNIKIKFCISWANEPWTRTWTGNNKDVLMPQKYGSENDWERHLQYLLPFFRDERYIVHNNRPVFLIYRTENIVKCEKMIAYWNEKLKQYGFEGIYVLEMLTAWQKEKRMENSAGAVAMEPMHCMVEDISTGYKLWHKIIRKMKLYKIKIWDKYDYDDIWNKILSKKFEQYRDYYYGGFMNWDNTARKGEKATFIKGFSLQKYKMYLKKLYGKCQEEGKEYLCFNAWNEWSEGTYLEPDSLHGYEYLETVREIVEEKQERNE